MLRKLSNIAIFLAFSSLNFHIYAILDVLPLPRFASIKFNEANARSGPSKNSTIEWTFIKKNEPVQITAEYEQWRKIRDVKGEGGWVHVSLLSNKLFVVVINDTLLMKKPLASKGAVAKLRKDVRCKLKDQKGKWSKITCEAHEGWVENKDLWGILQKT